MEVVSNAVIARNRSDLWNQLDRILIDCLRYRFIRNDATMTTFEPYIHYKNVKLKKYTL